MQFLPMLIITLTIFGLWFWHHQHKKKYGLKGSMGWLLIFNIQSIFNSLFFFAHGLQGTPLETPYNIVGFLVIVLTIYTLYLIICKQNSSESPKRIIKLIWLKSPIPTLILYIINIVYLQSILRYTLNETPYQVVLDVYITPAIQGVIPSIVFAYIWTLYFKKSERVKNTFSL